MSSSPGETDRALIARVEARDADALGALYDMYAARLLGLAARILGDTGEAEEVLQEVFLFVWRAAASFDPARGSVLAWLLVAAHQMTSGADGVGQGPPPARTASATLASCTSSLRPIRIGKRATSATAPTIASAAVR